MYKTNRLKLYIKYPKYWKQIRRCPNKSLDLAKALLNERKIWGIK